MATHFRTALHELASAFERAQRADGATYYRIKDASRAWCAGAWFDSDAMHAVHDAIDGRLPDDWVYEHARCVAWSLCDHDPSDADEARDATHEVCDGLVPAYNSERYAWLAAHGGNASLVDEACSDMGIAADADITDRIAVGMYAALERIAGALIDACEREAGERKLAAPEGT